MLGQILSDLAQVDTWLDEYVSQTYKDQPLAQDWARIAKIGEELGEVVDAYIAYTGQNPRKPAPGAMGDVMKELTDVAYTAILAMLHFTKDPATVGTWLVEGNRALSRRMMDDKSRRAKERAMERVAPSQRALDAQNARVKRITLAACGECNDVHVSANQPCYVCGSDTHCSMQHE